MIRNKQSRVKDPTNTVIDELGRAESLVTAFMGNDPDTSSDNALGNPINWPEKHSCP